MADLGAETALNLDGGGSTTMIARPLGNPLPTLRNIAVRRLASAATRTASACSSPRATARVHDLVIVPRRGPRLPRPAPRLQRHRPSTTVTRRSPGRRRHVDGRQPRLHRSRTSPERLTVTAKRRAWPRRPPTSASSAKPVKLEPTSPRLSAYADAGAANSTLRINGRDADAFTTTMDPADHSRSTTTSRSSRSPRAVRTARRPDRRRRHHPHRQGRRPHRPRPGTVGAWC